ncbi:GNAT family N-acetyltransferase [Acetobacter musti]|uniref:GNAT family N-acetyltransferase n=1 Tax=Acetobacter musti TaxID=864732 RepID=A0ABX0JUB9_9PROT|nr:GNAT family N-acetyltransferase [Acetobacter musti]NHN85477.1 GNAT family N-acetyltransferase [Acetobacter musti]
MSASSLLSGVSLRDMRADDLDAASGLSKALGWPHRLEDWQFMFALGDGMVATGPDDALIGTIMWWSYGTTDAAFGMIIVADAWQGHGIGGRLMRSAKNALPGRVLHLNATAVGLPLYEKMGFLPCGIVEQRQARATIQPVVPLPEGARLRPAGLADLQTLIRMDSAACGLDRSTLMERLLMEGDCIMVDGGADDGVAPQGFAFCRKFGWGNAIGPVVAEDSRSAMAMIAYWIGSFAGQFIRIDIPLSGGLSSWLDEAGLLKVDSVTTMSTGVRPERAAAGPVTFALCSQALG